MIVRTADEMRSLGARVARLCRPGDVIVLTGDLGAGKTTFVQGMGAELGIPEHVTSPTFVIARVHRSASGTQLVHVDAYRLSDALELDDLDLDADVACSITVIEWGQGHGERLAPDRLIVSIRTCDDDSREVRIEPVGDRWTFVDLTPLEDAA